jgi:predicted CoA-binding protein
MRPATELIEDFVNRRAWAVVGVSQHSHKFGHIIFKDLLRAGYEVQAVGRDTGSIAGLPIYQALADLPAPPDVVDIVVPPHETENVVRDCARLGLKRVWMQPGAASPQAVAFCQEQGIEVVYGGPCAMVLKRRWEAA